MNRILGRFVYIWQFVAMAITCSPNWWFLIVFLKVTDTFFTPEVWYLNFFGGDTCRNITEWNPQEVHSGPG